MPSDRDDTEGTQIEISSDGDGALPSVNLFSQMIDRVTFVSSTDSSLIATLGQIENQEENLLLFPFIEMRFDSDDDPNKTPLFMATLTMDNAAYLLSDVCADFQEIFKQFALMARGGVAPEPVRMKHTKRFLQDAHRSIGECLKEMERP